MCENGSSVLLHALYDNSKWHRYIFFNNKIRSGANRIEAVKAGGVEVIMEAIRKHIKSINICINGTGTLKNMVIGNSKNDTHNYL